MRGFQKLSIDVPPHLHLSHVSYVSLVWLTRHPPVCTPYDISIARCQGSTNWNHNLVHVRHQDGTPKTISFIHKGVLFCSFHVLNASILNVEIWNEKVKANVRWLESELVSNAFQNDVGAIVLLAHAQPHTRRYREFYESLLIVSSQIDKPIMYLHGNEKQFSERRVLRQEA